MSDVETWVRRLLDKPYARDLFGIELVHAQAGAITLALPHKAAFEHAPGYFQGAITTALGELAASYSALTCSHEAWEHATLEQSIRFIGPARGARLVAEGRILKSGRTVSFAAADVFADSGDERMPCAVLSLTMLHRPLR